MGDNGAAANRDQVLAELRSAEKLIVVSHENPDGDALGSLIAMQEILAAQGRDSEMFIDASEFPLPQEYQWFELSGLVSSPPDDLEERTIVFLDCGNLERNPAEAFRRAGGDKLHIVNIDHHHDNTHVRDRQLRPARGVVHGRDRVGSDARPGGRADAQHRRGAVRRA